MHMNPDADELFGNVSSPAREQAPLIATTVAAAVTLTVILTVALTR